MNLFVVMLSVALREPAWFLFTAFVAANLFRSALTTWCPMMTFRKKLGVSSCAL
jgi:hypothetical protein